VPQRNIEKLLGIMASLRHPDKGCPWDLQQTFKSIVPYTLEEAHEVAETIEHNDMAALKDELGDLLFQVVFYARLAEEDGLFAFDDVVEGVCAKMIRRHPHVFGEQSASAPDASIQDANADASPGADNAAPAAITRPEHVAGQWERIKAEEKQSAAKNVDHGAGDASAGILDGVPPTLPALSRAIKLQNKAARVGFDWPSLAPVFDKAREEFAELEHEITQQADIGRVEDEFGDVLFVMANVGRHLKLDPEQALRGANNKFIRRFTFIEQSLAKQGKTPDDSSLEEMEELWNEAKKLE